MELKSLCTGSTRYLNIPPDLTKEELLLKTKYEELKKAKEKLFRYQTTGRCFSPTLVLKNEAKKCSIIKQKEIILKKTSDFKKSSTKQQQTSVFQRLGTSRILEDDAEPRSISIKGKDLTDSFLHSHFDKFGYIWKIRTNENMTSSILTFKRPSSAKLAIEELNGHIVNGTKLSVSFLRPKNTSWCNRDNSSSKITDIKNQGRSVHIFFTDYLTSDDLEDFFQSVGRVTKIYLNLMKRFGFVTFEKEEQAQRAMKELNGDFCKGAKIIISPQKFLCTDAVKGSQSSETGKRDLIVYDVDVQDILGDNL